LPAEAHDTEKTKAFPPAFKIPEPGTSIALRHDPCFSLTTNACK
jgi:hypothetical protein